MAFTNRIDLIVLVTGDADFVPLVWALKRRGVRVGGARFPVQASQRRDEVFVHRFIRSALRNAAHFCVDVAELERRRSAPQVFGGLFPGRGRFEPSRPPRASARASVSDASEEKGVES